MQRSALCRSRRELSNEYLRAKFGFDTAENEPCQVSSSEIIFGCCQTTGREACSSISTSGATVVGKPQERMRASIDAAASILVKR